ncbi:uncharacterized protein LOC129588666 [Paramacrobiotus metropolitanus]|uniref:uncharacterized protein LOC129588666 n=1 Tax=Paramacrobiotus metropolitanus TaxID=2943436 RepID=UPI002445AD4F|nr:uncharacterized protein LOC129588666 [Paramacrobiotus metropolitanus]
MAAIQSAFGNRGDGRSATNEGGVGAGERLRLHCSGIVRYLHPSLQHVPDGPLNLNEHANILAAGFYGGQRVQLVRPQTTAVPMVSMQAGAPEWSPVAQGIIRGFYGVSHALDDLKKENEELRAENTELKRRVRTVENSNRDLMGRVHTLENAVRSLTNTVANLAKLQDGKKQCTQHAGG